MTLGEHYSSAALDYFRDHAIDPTIAAAVGTTECGGSLAHTYRADDGSTYQRLYALSPNGGPRVRQPAGQGLTLWRPLERSGDVALICEGESDALAALTALRDSPRSELSDLPVLAVPGTGYPVDRLVEDLRAAGVGEALLAFDADEAGGAYTDKAAGALRAAGIRPIPVKLPDGADLAETAAAAEDAGQWLAGLLSDSSAAAEEIDDLPVSTSSVTTLRRLDVAHMVRELPPPIPWVIDGLAVRGCLTLLTGREGEGKSLLAASLAGAVAAGESLAGMDCLQGTALVVDAENGEHEIHRRIHSLGLPTTGVEVVEADGFHLSRNLDELIDLIRDVRPLFVVLDSFRSLWPGGDENDPAAAAAVLDPLRNALRAEGAAGLLLHHLAKGAGDYRGSTAIGASVELGFKLTRAPDDPEKADRRKLDCYKCRPAPEPERRWLRLHVERGRVFVDTSDSYEGDAEPTAAARPVRTELAPDMLAAAAEPIAWPELARAIGREPKDGTARRLRDDLLTAGELERRDDGCLLAVKVPEGLAPSQTAWSSGIEAGCQSAGVPIGGGRVVAPGDRGLGS
jgi:AAA domain/Toprim-like